MRSKFDVPRVTAVRHVRDHVLWIGFADGVSGTVDLSSRLVGPALEPLRDSALFADVRIGADTIEWPNGVDWSPESLHEEVLATIRSPEGSIGGGAIHAASYPGSVPEISRFYGIIITMFYEDHEPPHFHARLGGESIVIEIDGHGLRGSFPPNRLPLLFEWRDRHRAELRDNWHRMRAGRKPLSIAPLG